jgi:hypothetical protein
METTQNFHRFKKQRLQQMRFYFIIIIGLLLCQLTVAQRVQYPATGLITVPRWEGSGIPAGWTPPNYPAHAIERWTMPPKETFERSKSDLLGNDDPDAWVEDGNAPNPFARTNRGSVVSVGRSFVANNLFSFYPCDNAMAISDSGFIVSADNYTIEYYDDSPDSLLQNQLHDAFYNDVTLLGIPFDPRVIYDRYNERFIVVMLAYADSAANQILLSVSKGQDPRNGWHHYRINSDTLTENKWFDYASIAVNKHELFISGNVLSDAGNGIVGNKIFQVRKKEILSGQAMTYRVWLDALDADGDKGFTIVPVSDGLMREKYDRGIYLVSTDLVSTTTSSNDLNWFQITDSLDAANVMLTSSETAAGVAYSDAIVGLQLNGDNIKMADCRVQSGFFLDSIINFVFCKNTNNYSTIVLNRLDVRSNTNKRYPWGFSNNQLDYTFPSIAFWGSDSSDADNIMMCFQRTSSTIYPELMAVNFQGDSFAVASTVVRQGDGAIDLVQGGGRERWGDYTAIQRRYGAIPKACWLAGSYPFGANPNFYGQVNGLNTFVAEVADSFNVSVADPASRNRFLVVFPNPSSGSFFIEVKGQSKAVDRLRVVDSMGRLVLASKWSGAAPLHIDISHRASGFYFIHLTYKDQSYEVQKLVLE